MLQLADLSARFSEGDFIHSFITDFCFRLQDKDSKIAFLQKAIDVVMLVSGEPLAVKPVRIVCGHEPEKTNEMLQAIAKCCLNKVSLSVCL